MRPERSEPTGLIVSPGALLQSAAQDTERRGETRRSWGMGTLPSSSRRPLSPQHRPAGHGLLPRLALTGLAPKHELRVQGCQRVHDARVVTDTVITELGKSGRYTIEDILVTDEIKKFWRLDTTPKLTSPEPSKPAKRKPRRAVSRRKLAKPKPTRKAKRKGRSGR